MVWEADLKDRPASDHKLLFLPESWYLKPKTKLTNCVLTFNKHWILLFCSFRAYWLQRVLFLLSLLSFFFFFKLKIKQYAGNILIPFSVTFSLQWKLSTKTVLEIKYFETFGGNSSNNFIFSYCCKVEG